jgi:hypothetical protein
MKENWPTTGSSVSFFIETRNQESRNTRFSQVKGKVPARIEASFSSLIDTGWVILSDLLLEDFPQLRAHASGDLYHFLYKDSIEDQYNQARLTVGHEAP